MAYKDQWKLLNDPDFRGRVTVAGLHASVDILNEDPATDDHERRVDLAYRVQQQGQPTIDALVLACAMNPTIAAAETANPGSSADGDLDYVVQSSWDRIAAS